MSRRVAATLAWSLGGLSFAMFGACGVLLFLYVGAGVTDATGAVGQLFGLTPFLAFPIVGTLIATRRPENSIGWICLTVGLFWMVIYLKETTDAYAAAKFGSEWASLAFDALYQASWVPPVGLLGIYMVLLFPDGRLPSKRWRPFALFAGGVMALICVMFVLVPGPVEDHAGALNPFGLESLAWAADVVLFVILLLPVCIVVSALSLVLRYRRSGAEVREQIKWVAFAACFAGAIYLSSILIRILFVTVSMDTATPDPFWLTLLDNFGVFSYAGIPVAMGFAILKYRLYDIDVIINRAIVYGSLTLMLLLVYFGGVVTMQTLFRTLTGQEQQSQLAVVASTLAIAALFNPLRRRIQSFIDRRFYRSNYDARKTLEAFSARLREETDLDSLNAELMRVVRESMQPEHVSLWLREGTVSPGRGGPTRPAKVKVLHRG